MGFSEDNHIYPVACFLLVPLLHNPCDGTDFFLMPGPARRQRQSCLFDYFVQCFNKRSCFSSHTIRRKQSLTAPASIPPGSPATAAAHWQYPKCCRQSAGPAVAQNFHHSSSHLHFRSPTIGC